MGLIADIEKRGKRKLYFEEPVSKVVKPVETVQKPVKPKVPGKPRLLKPEAKKFDKGAQHMSLETGKLHVHREEGDIAKEFEQRIEKHPAGIEKQVPIKVDVKSIEQKLEARKGKAVAGRTPTGIKGLDELMEGGLKKNSVTIVGGGAGCGKSIFCMQFLIKGIEDCNEPGVYISFEENPDRLLEDFRRFGWDIEGKIKRKQLIILYYTPEQVEKVLEAGGGLIRDAIESINAKRIVIDSLTAFTLLHERELDKVKALLKLFDAILKWNVTAVLTSEQEPDPAQHKSNMVEFEVDGVILLYNVRKKDIRARALEIFKLRGVKHATKIFPMKIDDSGITVFPEEEIF